ncbi:hypothetical protein FVEN_g7761 [Fusarium venenatum]|uniref:Protein kinase domain-containing protein n=1 Tax=Fusarium venenatum TaxID=56646 RepID=A0A2L2TUR5_9HYPO|nr:uncharacterized protein FVRRES_08043 [Fusarium venenatum]KAG8354431.1 hypothetical protein FVEN_g7761 [Fusarium venenatum]KAH6964831.1 hypothetical protein EDB82DRAFT_466667 [Fusarium venenatum]CEI67966.1 unnamed protein product [Fusarium venenatum]
MESFTNDNNDGGEFEAEYSSYTCDNGIEKLTQATAKLTLSSQNTKNDHHPAPFGQAQARIPSRSIDKLPITYQLMTLINEAKFNGSIITTWFGHHDFVARPSRQIARGGYFQTRYAEGLGVAKYPILATESKQISERSYKALANELRVLSHPPLMEHENIVNIKTIGWTRLDACSAAWMPMIVLEFAHLGTLTEYLSTEKLGIDSKLQVARDVGTGLQALHTCGIMHGDLKLDNILMFKGRDGKIQAKLCDFGCSHITNGTEHQEDKVEISAGTKPWNSPELYKQVPVSQLRHIDTYSFGLLVWRVLLNGRNPFEGLEQEEIDKRKAQDLIVSDASLSVEDEYDRNIILRGAVSSTERAHLYMRDVAMPKRCFRYTLSSDMWKRDLDAAMESLSFENVYGTAKLRKPYIVEVGPALSSTTVEFLRLFNIPWTAQTMFIESLKQVSENKAFSAEVRANAYMQICYASIDLFGIPSNSLDARQYLLEARDLGSAVAASIFHPLMLATGYTIDESFNNEQKPWLLKAITNGCLLARREFLLLLGDQEALNEAEKHQRLLAGAREMNDKGVADAEYIETMFLPANQQVLKMLLGAGQFPINGIMSSVPSFMSRSMNTYLHAGAALGIDPDHFRNAMAVVDEETINMQDNAGNTALHLALRFGNVDNAWTLLEHGADASLENKLGETPWHWLISLEDDDIQDITSLMLDYTDGLHSLASAKNSEVNQFSIAHSGTPLHWAVDMRMSTLANKLLDCGADPLLEHQGMSSIDLSIQLNQVEILETLMDFVKDDIDDLPIRSLNDIINMQGAGRTDPINGSQKNDDILIMQAVGIHPPHERLVYCGEYWLYSALSTLEVLYEYCQISEWSEENNETRLETFRHLSFAATSGPEMMQQIIDATNIFPNSDTESAVMFWRAALEDILCTSLPSMVHFVIDKVRDLSPSSSFDNADTLLHSYCASLHADTTILESILKDCSNIDCTDDMGRTPLMNAVRERNFEIATYLLEHGADVNCTWVQNGHRVYMLYEYVVNNTDIDVIPLKYLLEPMHPFTDKIPLLALGPDHQETVLHLACKDGNPVIVDYLLSKLISKDLLDQRGEGGMTALHHAVFNGHVDVAMKLCQAGADVNARSGYRDMSNRRRSRPLDLCYRHTRQSDELLANKFGLERTGEDVMLGRFHIANYLVQRHGARRADRFLMHRSLAFRLSLLAAQDGMTHLLDVVLRTVKNEMKIASHGDFDYSFLLTHLLWLSAPEGHVSTSRLLLKLGADANYRSKKGMSLLQMVSWLGKAEMVYVLVKNGSADVNAQDHEGQSVTWYSVKSQDLATIRMVKALGGRFTIPRASLERILGSRNLPADLNPQFLVRFTGEPSDDDDSEMESDASEVHDEVS